MPRRRDAGRLDRRQPGGIRVAGHQPVTGDGGRRSAETSRQRRVIAGPGHRQQVALDRPSDRFVADGDRPVALHREPEFEGFGTTGQQVGAHDAVAMTRTAGGPWRGPGRFGLERRRRARDLGRAERPSGTGDQAQDPPALERTRGEPGHHEVLERAGQRCVGQLVTGGQQLLGDERHAARTFGDQEEEAGRGALAFDPFDQGGELVAIEWREGPLLGRARRGRQRRDVGRPRIVAVHHVRLVADDDRQPLRPRDARKERDERAGRGVGAVQVLEDQHHGLVLPEATEQAQDALERSGLAAFRRGGDGFASRRQARFLEPRAMSGSSRRTSEVAGPSRSARSRAAAPGASARSRG